MKDHLFKLFPGKPPEDLPDMFILFSAEGLSGREISRQEYISR